MLAFAPIAGRALAKGNGRRVTAFLVATAASSVASTATTSRAGSADGTVAPGGSVTSFTFRVALTADVIGGGQGVLVGAPIRVTSVAGQGGGGIDLGTVGIHMTSVVAGLCGLIENTGFPIWLGRPGTQQPGVSTLYGYERTPDGAVLGEQRPADAVGGAASRPAAESVVSAAREASTTSWATSRKASGASASTQRSASKNGPALRTAEQSPIPGTQR
jgi:hypothetical protein